MAERLRALVAADPAAGYRVLHGRLREEPGLAQVSLKKVQVMLKQIREHQEGAAPPRAGPGENIWTAAGDGDVARVEELLELEGFKPTSPDENGYTPVHAAASWGRTDMLRLLLRRAAAAGREAATAAANVPDSDGDTPLHHVAGAEELEPAVLREVLDVLLEHGARPGRQNGDGRTCLEVCAEEVFDDEREPDADPPAVNLEFVKAMAERGFEIENLEGAEAMEH